MKRNVIVGIFLLYVLQAGFLLYQNRTFNRLMLRNMGRVQQRLAAEGFSASQAFTIASEIESAESDVASQLWNAGWAIGFTNFMMILIVASIKPDKKVERSKDEA